MPAAVKEIRALSRGVKVMETLCRLGACSLADLNRQTGLPKSTLRRILLTFEQANFLRCSLADGLYRANISVPSYADAAGNPPVGRVVAAARPVLEELAAKVLWPSDLLVRDGPQLRIVETNRALTPLLVNRTEIGDHVDFLNTAVGRAYLAFCPPAESEEIIAGIRKTRGALELRNISSVLNETRKRGYGERDTKFTGSTDRHPFLTDRLYAVAVPILLRSQVLGCINLLWPRKAMASVGDIGTMAKLLRQSATVIAHNYKTL